MEILSSIRKNKFTYIRHQWRTTILIYLFIYLFVCLFVYLFTYLFLTSKIMVQWLSRQGKQQFCVEVTINGRDFDFL